MGLIADVPHVHRWKAFMDARAMVRNPLEVFERYRQEMGPNFTVHVGGGRASLVTTDPDVAQHVLQTNWSNYRMSDIRVKRMGEFQGQGLLNSHGEEWRKRRKFLGKGFTPSRLSELLPVQEEVLNESLVHLDELAGEGPVDMGRVVLWINLRLFGRSVFGVDMTDEEIRHISSTIVTVQEFMLRQIVRPYMIPWYRISGQSRRYQRMRQDADQVARRYIARRKRGDGAGGQDDGRDLLGLMLETPYPGPGGRMSEDQILVEALQLFVAGNETSPTALTWALHLLGRHPHVLAAMREEVEEVVGDGPFTFEGLHRLDLTRRVIEETLRLYPSFWMFDRVAVEDDEIGGIRVPAGISVLVFLYGLHRNTDIWKDPETFDPDRFTSEASEGRSRFAFLPFGGGPRKCIGTNMALVQMLLVMASLVRRYDFEPASPGPVELQPMMILHPKGEVRMRLTRV